MNECTLNAFQNDASRFIHGMPEEFRTPCYALGVAGEAGEVADLLKKHLFHGHSLDRDKLVKELGDVLWYVAAIGFIYGIPMQEIADVNIEKLSKRYPDGFSNAASIARADINPDNGHGAADGFGGSDYPDPYPRPPTEMLPPVCRCFNGADAGHDCKSGDVLFTKGRR
jgi:NTP pyrophosphatase (non-canonical NTP hydrolase)